MWLRIAQEQIEMRQVFGNDRPDAIERHCPFEQLQRIAFTAGKPIQECLWVNGIILCFYNRSHRKWEPPRMTSLRFFRCNILLNYSRHKIWVNAVLPRTKIRWIHLKHLHTFYLHLIYCSWVHRIVSYNIYLFVLVVRQIQLHSRMHMHGPHQL